MQHVREIVVPAAGAGLRLDRFLSLWLSGWTRSALARGIKAGQVTDAHGTPLRASRTVREGDVVRVAVEGIAATGPKPPLPPILHEDARVVVLDKPAGLPCHPGGAAFTWSVVALARDRWPHADLVHRLDRDTSGVVVLTKDTAANAYLKQQFHDDHPEKHYIALARGPWPDGVDVVDAPIGAADGPIRIQMAVRPDGQSAQTGFRSLGSREAGGVVLTRLECRLYTGRTHQIRVHAAHVAQGLVGDRMYGVPPDVFLRFWEGGVDDVVIAGAGAPRQALHAARLRFTHPDGGDVEVHAPVPEDMERWWSDPSVLPYDRPPDAESETG